MTNDPERDKPLTATESGIFLANNICQSLTCSNPTCGDEVCESRTKFLSQYFEYRGDDDTGASGSAKVPKVFSLNALEALLQSEVSGLHAVDFTHTETDETDKPDDTPTAEHDSHDQDPSAYKDEVTTAGVAKLREVFSAVLNSADMLMCAESEDPKVSRNSRSHSSRTYMQCQEIPKEEQQAGV